MLCHICDIYDQILYVNFRFYIFNEVKLDIKIIKYIYEILLKEHVDKLFIYDRINCYYY